MSNPVYDATGAVVSDGATSAPVATTTTTTPTTTVTKVVLPISTLEKVEKAIVWVVGLCAAIAGPLAATKGAIPVPIATVITAILPVALAVERYASTQS